MGWASVFNDTNMVAFMLLFFRFAALFIATPIYDHKNIPMNIKASMAFFFTVVFYSSMPPLHIHIDVVTILVAVLGEFFSWF